MTLRRELTEEERYDTWAVRRIMDGEKCHVDGFLRCIPSRANDCKICYQRDVRNTKKEGIHNSEIVPGKGTAV